MPKPRKKKQWIVGVDEVGRGPLAGPVTVGAVLMRMSDYRKMQWVYEGVTLRDSKQMSAPQRAQWMRQVRTLKQQKVLSVVCVSSPSTRIDQKGIAACIRSSVATALKRLGCDPNETLVMLDGGLKAPAVFFQETIVRGDDIHKIISLASVIAKEKRDAFMHRLGQEYPLYGWKENKGYGTAAHRRALKQNGPTIHHRKTFISRLV